MKINDYTYPDPVDTMERKKSEPEGVAAFDELASHEIQTQQRNFSQENELHQKLTKSLIEVIPNAEHTFGKLNEVLTAESEFDLESKNVRNMLDYPAIKHQQQLLQHKKTSNKLIVKGVPYDYKWTDRLNFGLSSAEPTQGTMDVYVSSSSKPYHMLNETSSWIGAGLGTLFQPSAKSTYVRVAPYLRYSYEWANDSWLAVARNRGELCVRVLEQGSGTIILDKRIRLWNNGTSWYQSRKDRQEGIYNDSNYFFANSAHKYEVWFWINSSIDFQPRSGIGPFEVYSHARNDLYAALIFVVFEQWT